MNTTSRAHAYSVVRVQGGYGIRNLTVGQNLLGHWEKREFALKCCMRMSNKSKPLRTQYDAFTAIKSAGSKGINLADFTVAYCGPDLVKEMGKNKKGELNAERKCRTYLNSLIRNNYVEPVGIEVERYKLDVIGKSMLELWNEYKRLIAPDKWRGNPRTNRKPTAAA